MMYRRIGAITAYEGCLNPKFVQTYFYCPEDQCPHRANWTQTDPREATIGQESALSMTGEHHTNAENNSEMFQETAVAATMGEHSNQQTNQETSQEQQSNLEEDIFDILQRVLVEDCHNTYLASFYTINEFITAHDLTAEDIQIEFIEADDLP
jgi:hypothetical protein